MSKQTCTACNGYGNTVSVPCTSCTGRGTVSKRKRIKVRIPSGVDSDLHMRLLLYFKI